MAKTTFNCLMEESHKAAIEKAAQKEIRSLTSYVINACLERAKELYGIVPDEESEIPPE